MFGLFRSFTGHGTGHRKGGRGPVRNNINMLFFGLRDFLDLEICWSYIPLLVAKLDLVLIGIRRGESDKKERYIVFKYFL